MTKSYQVYFPDEQVHFWINIYYWPLTVLTLELVIFQKMELLKPFLNKFDAPIKLLVKLYFLSCLKLMLKDMGEKDL